MPQSIDVGGHPTEHILRISDDDLDGFIYLSCQLVLGDNIPLSAFAASTFQLISWDSPSAWNTCSSHPLHPPYHNRCGIISLLREHQLSPMNEPRGYE